VTRRVAVVVGNPKPVSRTRTTAELVAGVVAVPLMLGAGPGHALAPELLLRPVLTELGASVPTRGLYVLDSAHDDPAAWAGWLDAARPQIASALSSPTGAR
jgi:FMN reductase